MGTRSFFVAAAVAINLLFLATVAIGATPPYKCFPFSKASNAKSSNDKSGTSQLTTEEIKCPGPDCAAIEPRGDFNLEVNQTYEAYCLFDSRHINVDDVVFKPIFSDDHEFFEHEVVNSSAIKISVTPQKAEKYDLRCLVNEQHLCSRTVSIGYPPQDVENFSCISKNWSDLNCTWTVPYNPVQVQYYVTYVIHGFRKQSECPRNHAHQSGCYWPSEIFNHVVKYEWSVLINSTNKLEPKGVVYRHNFNSQETVLPNPVENLEAHVDGPNNVTLTWTLPHPMRTFSLILCEASYRERHDGDLPEDVPWKVVDRWKVQPNRWASKEDFNRTISNLHAFVQYDFRVRIHTGYGAVRPHMWSDAATLTKRTSASYPAVAPKTTLGTFQIEEMRSHLEMYVYWQKLDPFYYNGPDFHYEINAFNAKNNSWLLKKNFRKEYAYAKFPDMDKDISYRFEIIPVNGEGRPQNENVKSVVFVPERDELLKVPSYFKVIAYGEANRTVYSLKWRVDDDARAQGVETVTLFWCKKNKYEERCMNKLEWEIVQNPDVNIKNLTYLEEKPLYMFGISVNSRTSSSGIKWITCIASHGNRPPPIDQFEVTTESSKEVLLKWSLDCKAKAAEPIGFNISYCVAPEGSSKCPVDVEKFSEYIDDEAAVQHNVQNLHPYTKYIFNIAVLTQVGLSQWSKSILVKTESDKPSGPPRHLVQKDLGQTWVLLSWSAPDPLERNGEIIKYEVSRLYGGKQVVKYDNSSEFIQHNVTGLDPYTNYTFEVVPCTRGKSTYEPCGSHAAKIEIRTKIGAPLEVDDITQVDDILKWDHECISGPNCSYELVYTVNSTEHRYKTKPYAADVNLRDLNITCTQAEKKIVIKLRAFTHDETGRELYGPEKAQTITCYLPGSYSHDPVPKSISNNFQIILVHLPQNNQYNTVINLAQIPKGSSSSSMPSPAVVGGSVEQSSGQVFEVQMNPVLHKWIMGSTTRLESSNGVNVQQLPLESGGKSEISSSDSPRYSLVDTSSSKVETSEDDSGTSRPDSFRDSQVLDDGGDYHLVRHGSGEKLPRQNDIKVDTFLVNSEHVGGSLASHQNANNPHTQNSVYIQSSSTVSGSFEQADIELHETDHYPDGFHQKENLYPSKRPHGMAHRMNCPLLSLIKLAGAKVRLNASDTNFEFSVRAAGNPYSILKAIYQHSVQDAQPVAASEEEFVPDAELHSYGKRMAQSRGEEILAEDVGFTSHYELLHSSIPTLVRRDRRKVISRDSESFQSERSAGLTQRSNDTVAAAVDNSQRLLEMENTTLAPSTPTEATEGGTSDISDILKISKSREITGQLPVFKTSDHAREDYLSSEGLVPHPEEQLVTSLSTPLEDRDHFGELLQQSFSMHRERVSSQSLANAAEQDAKHDLFSKAQLPEGDAKDGFEVVESIEEPLPTASIIYRIPGSFNGNVGSISRRIGKRANEKLEDFSSSSDNGHHSLYSIGMSERVKSPIFTEYQRKFGVNDAYPSNRVVNQLRQSELVSLKPSCPFAELMKSRGVNVQFASQGDGQFEFNVRGEGNFYDLLEYLYDNPLSRGRNQKKGRGRSVHRFRSSLSSRSAALMSNPHVFGISASNGADGKDVSHDYSGSKRDDTDLHVRARSEPGEIKLELQTDKAVEAADSVHLTDQLESTSGPNEAALNSRTVSRGEGGGF